MHNMAVGGLQYDGGCTRQNGRYGTEFKDEAALADPPSEMKATPLGSCMMRTSDKPKENRGRYLLAQKGVVQRGLGAGAHRDLSNLSIMREHMSG
eukprot:1159511-Pelagomonas_calceolata.AAC.4